MPLAPVNPVSEDDEDEQVLPTPVAAPRPRTGSTGGVIPEQQSDIDARTGVSWSPDPAVRKGQVRQEIDKRRAAAFQKEHPFTPSGWQPKVNTPEMRREDREFEGDAESQFQYQQQTARASAVQKKRDAIAQRNAKNDVLEAQYRGSGQQFYTDSGGNLKPVIEGETGRELYNATGWEAGKHPKTGKPTLSMRDKYGQRQFKEAPVVASLDPTDDQMYYKLPDGTTAEAGSIDEFALHPNYQIAKSALAAKTRQVKAIHQEALAPMRLSADQSVAAVEDAKVEIQGLDAEIEKLSLLASNSTAPNGAPSPLSEGYNASLTQLQAKRNALDEQIKPRGALAQKAARAKASFAIASATAMRDAFLSQQSEIAARVKSQGGNLEADPTYQANLRGLQSAEQILGNAPQEQPAGKPAGRPAAAAPGAPTAAASPLEQSEPYVAAQNGMTSVGSVKMEEFARRYGDGRGPVQPASLLKLSKRSKEIEATLANDGSSINQTMRDQFTKEKEYIDSLFKQRFARLDETAQKRVVDATRDPTLIEKSAEFVGKTVGGFEKSLAQTGKGILKLGDYGVYKSDTRAARAFLDRVEARADTFGAQGLPAEVKEKLGESFVTGTLPGAVGSAASFMVPGAVVGRAGKVLQLSEKALRAMTAASVAGTGAASNSEAFAKEAEGHLRPKLESGEISREEFETSLGMARLFGAGIGATEAVPLGKFAQRLGGVPTGQGFLQKLFTVAGKGGTQRAAKWLAGEGKAALTEALEEGGQELVQSLSQDLYASESFDENRKVGADAAEQAAAGGVTGALMSIISQRIAKGGKPKAGKPAPTTPAPLTPAQQAAEAEFQKKLADEPAPTPSTAAEAAEVFEPALKEKANTPPPAKSAAESAAVMQDVATTEEAGNKVLSQQEAKAQKLVDQIQESSGKSREEILATRNGRDVAEWSKELETEAKYHASPLTVDPERRSTELKSEIAKLDQEWAKHLDAVAADAEAGTWMEKNAAAARERHTAISDRRAAIESELAKADAVRKSPKSAVDLKEQLAAENQGVEDRARIISDRPNVEGMRATMTAREQADEDAKVQAARRPDLEARRDAIESTLNEVDAKDERTRQSSKSAADLKNDLAAKAGKPTEPAPVKRPSGSVVEQVSSMTGDQFSAWEKENGGQTGASNKLGISMIGKPDQIATLKKAGEAAKAEWRAQFEKMRAAGPGVDVEGENLLQKIASKEQFFSEALSSADGTGSALQDKEVVAAHEAKQPTAPGMRSGSEVVSDIMAKNPHADATATKMLVGKKNYEIRDVPISEIGEVFGSKTVQPEVVKKYEATKSEDPIVLGRVAGSTDKSLRPIDGKHRLTAAKKRGDKTIKAYVPVEAKVEEAAKPVEKPAEPVHEIVAPKDAAPVSKGIEEHTAETVEGDKINKNWTAFGAESGTLGVPRAEMPQIKSEHRGALVNFLQARDVKAKRVMVRPGDLKPTQAEFSPGKVDAAREFRGSERPILISADGHLVDGHHQWMAGLQDDPQTPMPAIKLEAPIDKVLAEMKEFPSTESAVGVAAKAATKEPSVSAPPATKRLSDRAIEALQKAKIDTKGKLFDVTQGAYVAAHNAAIDLAILGVRAGRAAVDVTKLAVTRFKAKFPSHTDAHIQKLESDIQAAIAEQPPEPDPGTAKSKVPESLRKVEVPAEDIEHDVRAQNERMAEARAAISKEGATKAEEMISDRQLPADTRVAIGGVLLEHKMAELANAKPEDVDRITRQIQRITNATRSGVSTESGQGVAMHKKIYENLAVSSAMEYTKSVQKKMVTELGGKESVEAADAAAKVFNATKDQKTRDEQIDKLKEKYTTKPARRMLDQLKRIEVIKDLNKLGVLTREDMVTVAGNAIGIPGISATKLKNIADLANQITTAKNHAIRSRAELKLADTLHIYKGVNPLDLEASILTLNILSGYSTQLANLEGNALNLITQLGTTAMVNPTKLGPIMKGIADGIPLGWDQAKSILMTGRGTKDFQDRTLGSSNALSNVDYARDFPKLNETVGDVLTKRARVVEKISRFMKAADAVFYYPAREAYARLATTKLLEGQYSGEELAQKVSETLHVTPEAFESARKQATEEGYEGIDLSRRVSDIIEENRASSDVGKQAVKESERFAAEATFNNEPVGLAGVIYRNLARTVKDTDIGGVPVLKPWAMFLRVPANVFNATTNFTPIGHFRAEMGMKGEKYRKGGTGENQWRHFTKDERAKLHLQAIIGTVLMGALTARILDKDDVNISASGPNDPNKKAQLKASGWNPYSIKVGNKWISYKDSPLLVPLAIVGHVADSIRYQKSKSDLVLGSRVVDAVSHAPQIIFQTSMLSGLSELMSALGGQGDVVKSLERTLGSIPANLAIPYNRLLQQVDQSFDDKVYKENAAVDAVPFARRMGEVQTDIQGRERTFSPTTRFASAESNDAVDTLLRQKNIFIPEAGKDSKVGNRVMTDDEHTKYRRISGQRIRARIQQIAPQLRSMNQEQAQDRLEQISREERAKVRPLIGSGVRR